MAFKPATRKSQKLRMSITGPTGSGKTYTALTVAHYLSGFGKVAVLDTEHSRASLYAGDPVPGARGQKFTFDTLDLAEPFHPKRFVEGIKEAAANGYNVLIIDSLTHAWKGPGGMLDIVSDIAKAHYRGNTYTAWKDADPIQKSLIEAMLSAPLDIIATMRSKMDYAIKEDGGRKTIERLGMAPEQRDDMPYEFDVIIDMNMENGGVVSKTRCSALAGKYFKLPGKELAETLRSWLDGPGDQPAQVSPEQSDDLDELEALGTELYGEGWPTVRERNISRISKGEAELVESLSPEQVKKLVAGLQALREKRKNLPLVA